MGTRLRSWRQYIRKHRIVAIIISFVIAAMVLIFVESLINGTGFNGYYTTLTTRTISGSPPTITTTETYQPGKTLWDWLQLLIIPVVLASGAILFNLATNRNEQTIALDKQREELLQGYLEQMSKLLLENNLRLSDSKADVRYIARALTLTVFPRLDASRKGRLVQFLHESGLISKNETICIVHLSQADLSGADLSNIYLNEANLSRTNLRGANLSRTYLKNTDLRGADLEEANLKGADLRGADLSRGFSTRPYVHEYSGHLITRAANLRKANLSNTNLKRANLIEANLEGANLSKVTLDGETCLYQANLSNTKQDATDLTKANTTQPPYDEAE